MEVPLLLQFCIALFTGMVAATFVPPVRRSIPRPVEVILWIALITVCAVGVVSIADPNARELSASAAWGADQVINTTFGLMFAGTGGWLSDHRFTIASWLVIVAGADIFALMFMGSFRSAQSWQPRVRLREWMELPVPAHRVPAERQVVHADPLAGINRRLAAATAAGGARLSARMEGASAWLRDVALTGGAGSAGSAAEASRQESRGGFAGMREVTAHLRYVAHAWYVAAGQPALGGLAEKASSALPAARRARLRAGQVIDVRALLNAQSIGWYGPFGPMPLPPTEGDGDGAEPERQDRLAS